MKLSILIPAYNEQKTITSILKRIEAADTLNIKKELIIVDDASTDNTLAMLKSYTFKHPHKIITHKKNKGKGAAIRSALKAASGDIFIIQDADLEYHPDQYPRLLKPILNNTFQVVYGSRFIGQPFTSRQIIANPLHYFGNKSISFLISLLFFTWITDAETCYKCFTRKAIHNITLKENDFRFDPELTVKLLKRTSIKEVPITYSYRSYKEGKKISWKDGFKAVIAILTYRW